MLYSDVVTLLVHSLKRMNYPREVTFWNEWTIYFLQNPGRDIFFPLFTRKEIKTRKSEKKFKQHNISFKWLIMSFVQLTDLV